MYKIDYLAYKRHRKVSKYVFSKYAFAIAEGFKQLNKIFQYIKDWKFASLTSACCVHSPVAPDGFHGLVVTTFTTGTSSFSNCPLHTL